MTDDRMDALLHDVGGRWRDSHQGGTDVAMPTPAPRRGRPRWPLLVSAAAVAAALVAGLVITVAGLGGDDTKPTPAAGLANTVWRLMDGGRPAESGATLYVAADGTMVADDACAVVGTKLDAEDGKLYPTGSIPIRTRSCIAPSIAPHLGDTFVDLLVEFPDYSVDGDRLTIGSGASQLRFVADPALPRPTIDVPSIDEARWKLTGVRDAAGNQITAPQGVQFRITAGRLSTSDGCNEINADAAVDGSGLDLKTPSRTERGCVSGAKTVAVIGGVFDGVITQRVDGNQLTLATKGAGTLTYQWVPDDTTATDPTRLVGPDFRLVSVAGRPADGPYSINFRNGDNYGVDECDGPTGAAVLDPGAFRLAGGFSSGKICQRTLSTGQHDAVDRTLFGRSALWTLQDGKLVVRGDGAQSTALVFAAGATTTSSLQGRWSVLNAEPAADQGRVPAVLTFGGGRLRIASGCAALATPYTVQGRSIVLPDTMSIPYCTPGAQPAVVDVFGQRGRVSYAIDGDELTLTRDRTVLHLKRL